MIKETKDKIMVTVLFFLVCSVVPLTIHSQPLIIEYGIVELVIDNKDYKKYNIPDLNIYYTPESLTEFHMPIVIERTKDFANLKKMDLFGSVAFEKSKNSDNFMERIISFEQEIIYSDKDYFVVDFIAHVKASNKTFSIDYVPSIKGKSFSQFAWWNSSWQYKKYADVCDNITNYQIEVLVYYNIGGDIGCDSLCQTDFDDIRFIDTVANTELNYWLEYKLDSGYATFWVNISTADNISMYYSNPTVSTTSNGTKTFLFFDDFNDASINTTKWTVFKGGSSEAIIEETGGYLHIAGKPNTISSGNVWSENFTVTYDFKMECSKKANHDGYRDINFGDGDIYGECTDRWWHTMFEDGYHLFADTSQTGKILYYNCPTKTGLGDYETMVDADGTFYRETFFYDYTGALYWTSGAYVVADETHTTHLNLDKHLMLSQGEYSNGAGGDSYYDWVFVRLFNSTTESTFCNWSDLIEFCECLISNPSIASGSSNISVNTVNFTVDVNSSTGCTIEYVNISLLNCSHNVTSVNNGTFYLNISGCNNLDYYIDYNLYVNTSCDIINNTIITFKTEARPTEEIFFSNPSPTNNSEILCLNLTQLCINVNVSCGMANYINISIIADNGYFYYNATGGGAGINGTYCINITDANFTEGVTYTWYVNASSNCSEVANNGYNSSWFNFSCSVGCPCYEEIDTAIYWILQTKNDTSEMWEVNEETMLEIELAESLIILILAISIIILGYWINKKSGGIFITIGGMFIIAIQIDAPFSLVFRAGVTLLGIIVIILGSYKLFIQKENKEGD